MPRLSNELYYKRYEVLRWLWLNENKTYGCLSPKEQWAIHSFFQPSKDLSFDELVAHRRTIVKERPTLPARAGKAGRRLVDIATGKHSPKPSRSTAAASRQGKGRQVYVRGVVRPEIDVEKLARALLEIAEDRIKKQHPGGDS